MAVYGVWVQSACYRDKTVSEQQEVEMSEAQARSLERELSRLLAAHKLSDYKIERSTRSPTTAAVPVGLIKPLLAARAGIRDFMAANRPEEVALSSLYRLEIYLRLPDASSTRRRDYSWWIIQADPAQKAALVEALSVGAAQGRLHHYKLESAVPADSTISPDFALAFACPYGEAKSEIDKWLNAVRIER